MMRKKTPYTTKALGRTMRARKHIPADEFLEMQNLLFTLQELSQKLVTELNVENILNEIMKTLGTALKAVWVNIWELTADGKATFIRQGYGRPGTETYIEHSKKRPLKLGTAFIGRALKTKKTWSSSDMWTDPHLPRSWVARVKEQDFRGIVCVPQIVESAKVVGGMCVYFDKPHKFTDFEMRLITIAANEAAVAIVNAKIYDELARERDKTLAIINSLNEGIIMYDIEGRIILMNPRAQEMLLVQAKEVVGKILGKETVSFSIFQKNLYTIGSLSLGEYEAREYSLEGPVGTILEVALVPVQNQSRKKIGSLRILRDITKEKATDLLKQRFVSTASHQLRTPLTSLRWALDALRQGNFGPLAPEQKDLVEKTFSSATNLVTLINDLLDITKMEEGKIKYKFEKRNLASFVASEVANFDIQLKENKIHIKLDVGQEPVEAFFDNETMSMALHNIIDNAIRYSFPGKTVHITVLKRERNAIISVRDEGIGIPKEDQKLIFTKFFRAKNAQLYQTEGSGLGLYLAKSIIEKHNGRIIFESKENLGTEFVIHLQADKIK